MISSLDSNSEQFLNTISRLQNRMERAQAQIASGTRIMRPSDAPGDILDILDLQTGIQANRQTLENLERFRTEVDGAERALTAAASLVERATVLASSATSPAQSASTRAGLADEIASILQQMVGISNTVISGRYVFSGDQDKAPAYRFNLAADLGADRLLDVQTATLEVQDSSGTRFRVARTAEEIFDRRDSDGLPAPENAFAALNGVRRALLANDEPEIQRHIALLATAGEHLNLELALYGAAQGRLGSSIESAHGGEISLSSELGRRTNADMSAAILEMTQAQTQLDAALSARAKLGNPSLFDYLR